MSIGIVQDLNILADQMKLSNEATQNFGHVIMAPRTRLIKSLNDIVASFISIKKAKLKNAISLKLVDRIPSFIRRLMVHFALI